MRAQEVRARGIDVHVSPRGGQVTFHGPGQLVAYPVLGLRAAGLGARAYVEGLEDAIISTLGGRAGGLVRVLGGRG